jgi:toxin ParE1/3/4
MSARRLQISTTARKDLKEILKYTEQIWGKQRRSSLRGQILDRLAYVATYSEIGRNRPELGPDVKSFSTGSHIIYYQTDDTYVVIIRIQHEKMTPQVDSR